MQSMRPGPRDSDGAAHGSLSTILGSLTSGRNNRACKVLVVGNYGNGNTGDEAILVGLLGCFQEQASVQIITRSPESIQTLHRVVGLKTISKSAFLAFIRCDVLVIGGGGMFGRGLHSLVAVLPLVALFATLNGKKVVYAAIGAYPDMPRLVRSVLQLSARFATFVTARDEDSAGLLSSGWAKGTSVGVVEDPAVLIEVAPAEEITKYIDLAALGAKPIIVSLKALPDSVLLERVCEVVGMALKEYVAELDASIVFICLSDQGDYGLGQAVSDRVLATRVTDKHLDSKVKVVGPNLPPRVAKAIVGYGRGVIAMRLHAQIFAESLGVPVFSIAFEHKTRLGFKSPGSSLVEAADLDVDKILEWLSSL